MDTLQTLTQPLGWAILHSIWQGLLLYIVLRLVLAAIPGRFSSARYYTSFAFLSIQVVWFISVFVTHIDLATPIATTNAGLGDAQQIMHSNSTLQASYFSNALYDIAFEINKHINIIVGIYITGMTLLLARFAYNIFNTNSLKRKGVFEVTEEWEQMLANCADQLAISKQVRILLSNKISTPITMGSLKPVILIPVAIANQLSVKEAEAILLHELAHIKRNDFLINIVQMLIETIMFYNPFTWLISSIIRREREHCCDDMVVSTTNNKMPYAKALASIETYRQYPEQIAMAATGNKNYLLNRIKRIMEMKKTTVNQSQLIGVSLAILLTISSIIFLSTNIYAQKKDDKKDKKKTEKTVVVKQEKIVLIDDQGNKKTYNSIDDLPKEEKEKLQKVLGKHNATIVMGPKKKVLVKAYSSNGAEEDIDIDIDEEAVLEIAGGAQDVALKATKIALNAASDVLVELDIEGVIDSALNSIDWEEIKAEMKDAKKEMAQARIEIKKSMSEVDWEEIEQEIKQAKKEMTKNKIYVTKTMKQVGSINMDSIYTLDRNTQKQLLEAQKQLKQAQVQLAIAKNKVAIAEANAIGGGVTIDMGKSGKTLHKELVAHSNRHNDMLNMMEKDGLINRSKGYKIEKKGSVLYIDGIKQSKEVYKKYESMMDSKNLTIKGNKRSISINATD